MKKIDIQSLLQSDEMASNIIEDLKKEFKEMYGYDIEDNEEVPYIFWNTYDDQKQYRIAIINGMRQAGLPECVIYSYYKTGHILTENNVKYLSKEDIKEFKSCCKEYNRLIKEKLKNNECNSIQLVSFANSHLAEELYKKYSYIQNALHDYLRRHLDNTQDFLNYKIATEIDYLGFCCVKSLKDLDSIKALVEMQMVENIYAICRSLFESYIQIANLAHDKNYFSIVINNADNCTYDFKVQPDGSINYNELIIKRAKTKNISISKLCDNSRYKTDKDLYDIFYRSACQFIHLDIMSAKSYFHGFDPFHEIDASLIAALVGITFLTLMLEQFAYVKSLKPRFKRDIKYLTNNMKKDLILCYQIINTGEYNRNDLFSLLEARLKEEVC